MFWIYISNFSLNKKWVVEMKHYLDFFRTSLVGANVNDKLFLHIQIWVNQNTCAHIVLCFDTLTRVNRKFYFGTGHFWTGIFKRTIFVHRLKNEVVASLETGALVCRLSPLLHLSFSELLFASGICHILQLGISVERWELPSFLLNFITVFFKSWGLVFILLKRVDMHE